MSFYEELPKHWQPHSIGFDDVCVSYKDRQYVTQRPHPYIKFWTGHHGSAMGGAFGLGVGAKLADPTLHTFLFCGDGCWRLFGGCLADAAFLDLRLFIINNGTYGIVDKGLEMIIPTVEKARYHSKLPRIDFVAAAKAHGWEGFYLKPDLSNLKEIMDACYTPAGRSILVDVPVDNEQVVGLNARLLNLTTQAYL
jgi:acetolactate synthase-1/2/3 large subunit